MRLNLWVQGPPGVRVHVHVQLINEGKLIIWFHLFLNSQFQIQAKSATIMMFQHIMNVSILLMYLSFWFSCEK